MATDVVIARDQLWLLQVHQLQREERIVEYFIEYFENSWLKEFKNIGRSTPG